MVQGYYTLEEAAQILQTTPDQLKLMARRNDIRAFQDRGTWRFRTQDVEELARQHGLKSNPQLPAEPDDEGAPIPMAADEVEIGQEIPVSTGGSKSGGKSGPPKASEDSDVRLVVDSGDFDIRLTDEVPAAKSGGSSAKLGEKRKSGVKLADAGAEGKAGGSSGKLTGKRKTGVSAGQDSSARKLVAPDESENVVVDFDLAALPEDSLVSAKQPPKAASDSDVRLESPSGKTKSGLKPPTGKAGEEPLVTEEINLDDELKRAKERPQTVKMTKSRLQAKQAEPAAPTASPFELSEADLKVPGAGSSSSGEGSSEFELGPVGSSSEIELGSDEVELGAPAKAGDSGVRAEQSGINLQDPADSGISLEKPADDSSSEFELSLEEEPPAPAVKPAAATGDSSESEFELTLDDSSGSLPPLEEAAAEGEQKDIFETDFELPGLDEESGAEGLELEESDTDLESSDFELALGEDGAGDEESGSQVVALEDEEADEGAATVARPRGAAGLAGGEMEEVDDLLGEEDLAAPETEEAEEEIRPAPVVAAGPADWGVMTPIVLIVCAFVMLFVGFMSFELLQGMWGYHQPNKATSWATRGIAGLFTDELPKE